MVDVIRGDFALFSTSDLQSLFVESPGDTRTVLCYRTAGLCSEDRAAFTGKVSWRECGPAWICRETAAAGAESHVVLFQPLTVDRFASRPSRRPADLSHHGGDREGLLPLLLPAVRRRADSDTTGARELR